MPEPPKHTTHIHKVEIKLINTGDPGRVARAVMRLLKETARGVTNQCCKCDQVFEYAEPKLGFVCWECRQ